MKMKQILNKLFLFGILGSFVFLYSCGDDDTEDPVIDPPTIALAAATNGTIVDATADPIVINVE